MRLVAMWVMFSTVVSYATERLNVSVCNLGHLTESLLANAETEAQLLFHSMDVEVVWAKCQDEVATDEADRGLRFVIRLRKDSPPKMAGRASLDAMGRAYVSAPGDGYIADIYYKPLQEFAGSHDTDENGLLGYVIAHELGHLILGPGHSPHGIMRAPWNGGDSVAVKQRGLKFTTAQQNRIRQLLKARKFAQPASR